MPIAGSMLQLVASLCHQCRSLLAYGIPMACCDCHHLLTSSTSSSITGICILLSASEKTGGWRPANRMAIEVLPLFDSEVIRYPGMRARRFGRIVIITSAMVKTPHAAMGLSTAARAGLTALSKALAREAIIDNVTINNLLPERFDTPRQEFMAQRMMKESGITRDEARARIAATLPANRFGDPKEFGAACAFLCAVTSGFMTGQNLQLDGGAYSALI